MKYLIIVAALVLSGCASTQPALQKFPGTSTLLTDACPELEKVPEGTTKLSELEKIVANNYTKYHQCALKVEKWNGWYYREKKNYESAGK